MDFTTINETLFIEKKYSSRGLPSVELRDLLDVSRVGDTVDARLSFDLLPDELALS